MRTVDDLETGENSGALLFGSRDVGPENLSNHKLSVSPTCRVAERNRSSP